MVLPIYTYGTRVLRRKVKPVARIDEELIELIMNMFDTMHAANGIGLAANQVGELQRVIVIDISDVDEESIRERGSTRQEHTTNLEESKEPKKNHPPIVLINPEVLSSEGIWQIEEGCLSIPNVRDQVERAEKIRIRYKNTNFRDIELEADSLLARVILHEIDHLNGVLFIDHLSNEKRKVHKEQLRKIQRGEIEVEYSVMTASQGAGVESAKGI